MIVKELNTHNTIKTQKQVKTGLGRTHLLTDMHKQIKYERKAICH